MDIEKEVDRQIHLLMRGVEDIVSVEELKNKIRKSIKESKPLKVKLGIDPTGNSIHIGHAVPLRKLKQFQELGHIVQFLIGTFTAKIGDPTGKNETRKMLTDEEIQDNLKDYLRQVSKILDMEKTEVKYNGDWLSKLDMEDVLKLMAQFTVSQMTSREDFAKRLSENKPVSLVEFMYPILQGYDSVALECDVELGATEQKFNLLRGRDLQKAHGQEPQVCLMMPILEGTDGVQKMSKTLGNYIGVEDEPNNMFGKIMSIPDEVMIRYYKYVTELSLEEIGDIEAKIKSGEIHPMEAKKRLGEEVVKLYHDSEKAIAARLNFETIFSKKEIPDDIDEITLSDDSVNVLELLFDRLKFVESKSEARRIIQGNGLKIDGETIKDDKLVVELKNGMIIKCGKKKIVKIIK